MTITKSRTRHLHYFAQQRNCLPYSYGGSFSANPEDSTDCSGLVFSAAAILVGMNPHQRYGSTETLRLARINRVAAPCGLLPAKDKASVPRDAALKVGVQHGGGGPDSHTACTFLVDGVAHNFESRGYPGVILDQCGKEIARAWDSPLFHDFWYLPAADPNDPVKAFPLPNGYYFGPADGPVESIAGISQEPQVWLDRFKLWQEKAGDIPDGTYSESTAKVARRIQNAAGLAPTGFVDRKTWDAVMGGTKVDALTPEEQRKMFDMVKYIFEQMGPNLWGPDSSFGKTADGKELTMRDGLTEMKRNLKA